MKSRRRVIIALIAAFRLPIIMVYNSNYPVFGGRMYQRFVERRVVEALSDTPVVLITGPRRAGKTTLVRTHGGNGSHLCHTRRSDLPQCRTIGSSWVHSWAYRAIIDEIQRAPDLLLAIKKSIDEDYRPGRFS